MWQDVFNAVAANGIWAILFFVMLIVEIKDSRKREEKYQCVVDKLTDELMCVKDIKDEVKKIRTFAGKRRAAENGEISYEFKK